MQVLLFILTVYNCLIYTPANGSHYCPTDSLLNVCVCVCTVLETTFFHSTSSDCLTKRTPVGMHELTCCIFMPHISLLGTMREANQALSCPCWKSCTVAGEGDPMGCKEGGQKWTPRKSLGGQVTSLVQSTQKLSTGMMSYFPCQPLSYWHNEEPESVKTVSNTWRLKVILLYREGLRFSK